MAKEKKNKAPDPDASIITVAPDVDMADGAASKACAHFLPVRQCAC
jgi:hypothetical protein